MKSTQAQRAQRINAALSLLKEQGSVSKVADTIAKQYGISKRQAYRYTQEATKIGKEVPIPDRKIAFTVKLSQDLILAVREYAKKSRLSLSEIVTQSLEVFLQNGQGQRSGKKVR
jgi:hypothetical protein